MQQVANYLKSYPSAYWYLWLGTLINRAGNFVVPFLALYLTHARHLPLERAGLIVSMYGAGSLAAGPLGGHCADRFGRRRTMLVSMVTAACMMTLLGLVHSPELMGVVVLALGFAADAGRPAVYASVADVLKPGQRPQAYGLLSWAINLGFAIAPVVAGAVSNAGFSYLFFADAATTLVCAFIIWKRVPETKPARAPDESPTKLRNSLKPYRDPVFAPFVAVTFGTTLLFYQSTTALPLVMSRHGIAPSTFGYLIALNGLLIVVLQPFVLTFIHRLSRPHVLALGALLTGLGMGLTALATTPLSFAGTIVLWTLGEIALAPVGNAVVADIAPMHLRGCYQGAYHFAWGGAAFMAPIIGSLVLGHFGSTVLWCGCLWVGLAAGLGYLVGAAGRVRSTQVDAA